MQQIVELTKALHARMQFQKLLLQQEKFEKSQKIFQEEQIYLRNQQTKNTKSFCENELLRTTEECGSRFFSPEGKSNL